MSKTGLSAVMVLCVLGPARVAHGQTVVAIPDFTTQGLSEASAAPLTAKLQAVVVAELAPLDAYDPISSEDIRAMLALEKSADGDCAGKPECLAEIGGALGAGLLLAATIGRLGETYSLGMVLIETSQAKILARFNASAESDTALVTAARRGTAVLFGLAEDISDAGMLLVITDPPGAEVTLDGRAVGISPLTIEDVPSGDHILLATKDGLNGSDSVHLRPRAIEEARIELAEGTRVTVKILTHPHDCQVAIDGRPVGLSPLILKDVRPGRRSLRVQKPGYFPYEEEVDFSEEQFEDGGRQPLSVRVEMDRALELPFHLGVTVGAMVVPRRWRDRAAGQVELLLGPFDWLEIAVGVAKPLAYSARVHFLTGGDRVKVGLAAGFHYYRFSPDGTVRSTGMSAGEVAEPEEIGESMELGLVGPGITLEWSWPTSIGRFGVRSEYFINWTVEEGGTYTTPVSLLLVWRL